MMQKAFNLLDERWIMTTDLHGNEAMLSLTEVFDKAHDIKSLSGETAAQDLALIRLLLGILYPVYIRTDEYVEAFENESVDETVRIWKKIWNKKQFSNEVNDYLESHREGFWLFHGQKPFFQVSSILKGSDYSVSKMIGELVESNNKLLLFPVRSGKGKESIAYHEAARWLVYLSYFDDASAKKVNKNADTMSVGWLGKLCPVYAAGNNLFQTLLLNLVLLNDDKPWEDGVAAWEREEPNTGERTPIAQPASVIELYSYQARRIQLHAKNEKVIGYTMIGGDQFSAEGYRREPMTMWKKQKSKAGQSDTFVLPSNMARNPSKQLWRDLAPLLLKSEDEEPPGIIKWLGRLSDAVDLDNVTINNLSVKYGNMQNGIEEIWSDSISVNGALLASLNKDWRIRITGLVEITDSLVKTLGRLASNLDKAAGSENGKTSYERAMELCYAELDIPFRDWLSCKNPNLDDIDDACSAWLRTAEKIILQQGEALVDKAGDSAFKGRVVKELGKEEYYSSPRVYGWFKRSIYAKLKEKGYGPAKTESSAE